MCGRVVVGVGVDMDVCVCECIHTHRSEEQLLAFWRATNAFFFVGLFYLYTGLFCTYAGLFCRDVEGSFADEQTHYIHRFLLQKGPAQQGLISHKKPHNPGTLQHTATH